MGAQIGNYQEGPHTMFNLSLFEETTVKPHRLGTVRPLDDGRVFVLCKNGTVALAAGKLVTFITTQTNEQTVVTAAAAGDKTVYITAAGITANLWEDGTLIVTAGTGIGESYKIKGNKATVSGVVEVLLYDAIATAWSTTDTDISVWPNPYNAVVVNPTDAQQMPVGCPQRIVTASTSSTSYYFWAQVKGWGSLIIDTAGNTPGAELDEKKILASTNHAGYGMVVDAPGAGTNYFGHYEVGYLVQEEDLRDNEATLVCFDIPY